MKPSHIMYAAKEQAAVFFFFFFSQWALDSILCCFFKTKMGFLFIVFQKPNCMGPGLQKALSLSLSTICTFRAPPSR